MVLKSLEGALVGAPRRQIGGGVVRRVGRVSAETARGCVRFQNHPSVGLFFFVENGFVRQMFPRRFRSYRR